MKKEKGSGTTVWSVYMIRCRDDSLYTGITTDVNRRFSEHQSTANGSKYLRGRAPLTLVLEKQVGDRSLASKLEYRVKRLPRAEKEKLVYRPAMVDELVRQCS